MGELSENTTSTPEKLQKTYVRTECYYLQILKTPYVYKRQKAYQHSTSRKCKKITEAVLKLVVSPIFSLSLCNNSPSTSGNYGNQLLEFWERNAALFLSDLGVELLNIFNTFYLFCSKLSQVGGPSGPGTWTLQSQGFIMDAV